MRHLLTCGSVNDGNSTLQLSCSHLGALARQDARLRDLAGAPVPKAEQRCIGFLFWMSEDAKDRVYRVAPRIRGGTVMGWSPPGERELVAPVALGACLNFLLWGWGWDGSGHGEPGSQIYLGHGPVAA